VFGGVVTATALFVLTSWTPEYTFLGPLCATRTVVHPGFDLWTGQPHGRTYDCAPIDGSATTRITAPVPDDLIDRRAIPLPIASLWVRSSCWSGRDPGGGGSSLNDERQGIERVTERRLNGRH
jgi:hypothetical protein